MVTDELKWIDAHHHLWDLDAVHYTWLMAKGELRFFGQPDPIRKNYLAENYQKDIVSRISRSVHVQVGARSGSELQETAFVDRCSRQTGGRFPAAAVVAINLCQENIEADIEAQLGFEVTRGVRQIIGKSAGENSLLPTFRPNVWIRNWQLLLQNDLSFDLQLTSSQYADVLGALEQVPDLRVAICHLASPWDRTAEGFENWRLWMKRFAELPNVYMKISGLCMYTQSWAEDTFLQWSQAALELFGARRCMLGSNFPVDRLYVEFGQLFSAWQDLAAQCSGEDAHQLAEGTAARFYRI